MPKESIPGRVADRTPSLQTKRNRNLMVSWQRGNPGGEKTCSRVRLEPAHDHLHCQYWLYQVQAQTSQAPSPFGIPNLNRNTHTQHTHTTKNNSKNQPKHPRINGMVNWNPTVPDWRVATPHHVYFKIKYFFFNYIQIQTSTGAGFTVVGRPKAELSTYVLQSVQFSYNIRE